MDSGRKVGLVLDPVFGEKVVGFSEKIHVWVVDTPPNRLAVEVVWKRGDGQTSLHKGATIFRDMEGQNLEVKCEDCLSQIELHHGKYSQQPPYSALEVFGLVLSDTLQELFQRYGFTQFYETEHGFRAEKR